jgi:hypothetical protein
MTLDELKRKLQEHFRDRLVTIVGSGVPASAGLPTMGALAMHLSHLMPTMVAGEELDEWLKVDSELAKGSDLESALAGFDLSDEVVSKIVNLTAATIAKHEHEAIEGIVNGTHKLGLCSLFPHLTYMNGRAEIVTPNYDRLIEFAAEEAGYGVDTTFAGTVFGRFDPDISRDALSQFVVAGRAGRRDQIKRTYRSHVAVYKPHGSLDWFLRAGVPIRCWAPVNADRLMITPGRNKFRKGYDQPFDYHREHANAAIDAATGFLVLGYGFNDDQLETHLRQRLKAGYPCVILTLELTPRAAQVVAGCPSVIALVRGTAMGVNGTDCVTSAGKEFFPGIKLWVIEEFVKEVLSA